MKRPAPFLPDPEHVAYLANLLTVLAVFVGAYLVLRERHHCRRHAAMQPQPGWRAA